MAINEPKLRTDSQIHGATATQYRFTLHVPTRDNNGRPWPTGLSRAHGEHLVKLFGAYTRQLADGAWRNEDGAVYEDPQWLYHIDAADAQTGQVLREYAARIRDSLDQECVYVTCQQITTWLV